MNNIFKNVLVLFAFVFLMSGIFADTEILEIGSDAKEEGFLGIGDSIAFYVVLNEPAEVLTIEPKEYNSKKLIWATEDSKEYTAIYEIEEGDADQDSPLQLGIVKVILADGKELEKESDEIVLKSIDATRPKFEIVSLSPINYHNKNIYPIFFKLAETEIDSVLNYEIKGKSSTISRSVELRGQYEECLANPDLIALGCPITIYEDLSSISDGKINTKLEIIDRANNSSEFFETTVIKDTVLPEIQMVSAPNINASNYKDYSINITVSKEYKNIKLTFDDSVSVLSFERLENLDLSSLVDGIIIFKLMVSDATDNQSKEYIGELKKDLIAPILRLDQPEKIYINKTELKITGVIEDKLYEPMTVKYFLEDKGYDCETRHSPSIDHGYNYVTCNLANLKEGEQKVKFVAMDRVQNEFEIIREINVSTKDVYFDIDNGTRLVKNTSPEKINGKVVVNPIAETEMSAMLRSLKPGQSLNYRKYNVLIEDGKFEIDLSNSVSGTTPRIPLEEGEYLLSVRLKDNYGNSILKTQKIIIDMTNPIVEMDSLSTTNRNPTITGKVIDKNATEVSVVINNNTYKAAISGENWSVEVSDTLPLGNQEVKVIAKDEADNSNEISDSINIYSTGGGTRIVAETPTETVTPGPAPETPAAQPVVTEPTITNTPTTPTTPATGGTPVTTPAPTTGNIAAANPAETSGSTGFLGLPTGASTSLAIIVGALLVVGALGYFLFFAKK